MNLELAFEHIASLLVFADESSLSDEVIIAAIDAIADIAIADLELE